MTYRRLEIDRAYQTTCEWILQHRSYLIWTTNKQELLWLKGKPGSGKSTLLTFIYREYTRGPACKRAIYLDFFFHARGAPLQKTPEGMFRSLLHQVFKQCPAVRSHVRATFEEKKSLSEPGKDWRWHARELEDLLFNAIIQAAESYAITIFIDALDEAGAEVARELMAFFHRLKDETAVRNGDLKICISCRHYPVIPRSVCLEICVENENRRDISTYVINTLIPGSFDENSNLELTDQWHALAKDVIDKASGVFQWAKLVVPLINQLRHEGESISYIKERLAEVPNGLEEIYEHVLTNLIEAQNRPRTLLMMQWICLAVRPLSVRELRFAMASDYIESHELMHSCRDGYVLREDDERTERLIISLSGGLAEVKYHVDENYEDKFDGSEGGERHTTVQFIHQSVNDFLLSHGLEILAAVSRWEFSTQNPRLSESISNKKILGHCHQRLLRSCINYLKLKEVIKIVQDEFSTASWYERKPLRARFPFLDYATVSWVSHAQQAEKLDVLQQGLIQQFRSLSGEALKNWVHVYGIIYKYGPRCPQAGSTLLHIASSSNLQSTVHVLLEEGTDVDKVDGLGNTALHHAARWGHQELVSTLLNAKAKIDLENNDEKTPLMMAVDNGHVEIVKLLLHRGADVHIRTGLSGNALQAAARYGAVGTVQILLKAGADVNAQAGFDGNALQAAAVYGRDIVVERLLEAGADVNAQGGVFGNALRAASLKGYDLIVQRLLKAGADVNVQGGNNGNALQVASDMGHDIVVQRLLEAGADVNAQGGKYGNALQIASYRGHNTIFQRLFESGADVNAQGGFYGNALQAASSNGHDIIVEQLLGAGADVNAQGGAYDTALVAASFKKHDFIFQRLLEAGADIAVLSDEEQARAARFRQQKFSEQVQLLKFGWGYVDWGQTA